MSSFTSHMCLVLVMGFVDLCIIQVVPGGTRIIFWRGVRPEVWNPYPYLRIFLPQKTADLKLFFEIFANRDPFLRVFSTSKWLILPFFCNFCEMGPSSKDFFDQKMGPMSKDFCWKSNPFGRHIPVCLNMWVPPPPGLVVDVAVSNINRIWAKEMP